MISAFLMKTYQSTKKDLILNSYKFTEAKIGNSGEKGMLQSSDELKVEINKTNYHPI